MQTLNNTAKYSEISNNCEEYVSEDYQEYAREYLSELNKNYRLMWLTAININWRGSDGYAVKEIPNCTDLWSTIAGFKDADWTLRLIDLTPYKINAIAYSHDTPMGGGRVATFMDGRMIYKRLLACGWTFNDLVKELRMRLDLEGRWTKEGIIDLLQNDLSDVELLELF